MDDKIRELLKSDEKQPPEHIWHNIRNAIIAEQKKAQESPGILERLKSFIPVPRPVFALAGVLASIIIVVVLVSTLTPKGQPSSMVNVDESLSVYSLGSDNEGSINGLGTNIEEYFL